MKEQDLICGFRVKRIRSLPEVEATMVEMVYEKTKTPLVWLSRADTNKTFSVTFKTIPEDATGVFHILEHSVLCGSDKYPLKDPFVELLKGSLQTFLNAMTFPDKTMYPFSSRNEQDFLQLMDVYMDAVLHPQMLRKPEIFWQEGWHLEWDEAGKPSYKGVVFNEMKGAYSSVDDMTEEVVKTWMYPANCYGRDSGGDPTVIPDLTYEAFKAAHQRYYHPSNARIFLDGDMQIETVLAKLDGILAPYTYAQIRADIPAQPPLGHREWEGEYEISEAEDEEGKVRMTFAYDGFSFEEQRESLALDVIGSVLCGSNESPLKAALLGEDLCEDVILGSMDGIMQSTVTLDVIHAKKENLPRIRQIIKDVMTRAAAEGLEPRRMMAALNSMEFRLRERDYGRMPRGLVYAISALGSWLYDGDPAQNFRLEDALTFLREHLTDGYFEGVLRRVFLDNPHTATLTFYPSKTLAARRLAAEQDRLAKTVGAMSPEEVQTIKKENERLSAWQTTEDSPAVKATLPTLPLDAISPLPEKLPYRMEIEHGVPVLRHDVATAGICYLECLFAASDTKPEDLPYLTLLSQLFTRTATDAHDTLALQDEIQTWLGFLSLTASPVYVTHGDASKLYIRVNIGVLETNLERVLPLLGEVLFTSHFDNKEQMHNILRQMKLDGEDYLQNGGDDVGLGRVAAQVTGAGAASEYLRGYENYVWVKNVEKQFDERFPALAQKMQALIRTYITRERLTLSIAGPVPSAFVKALADMLPSDGITPPVYADWQTFPRVKEGIRIPSQVSYAVKGGKMDVYSGAMEVARKLISYEYLWSKIRVEGGAYGAGQVIRPSGLAACYSYRDPSGDASLAVYDTVPAFLREFCRGKVDLTKYIIGAVGASEPLMSPRAAAAAGTAEYLREDSYEDACQKRREMLGTGKKDLLVLADAMEKAYADAGVCLIGGKDKVDACQTLDVVKDM